MRKRTLRAAGSSYGVAEPLESRRLLSTIGWTNRGSSTNDSDGLNALFGSKATDARFCIDRAILDWEDVISNFNYNNGGNTFLFTVSTAALGGNIADSSITSTRGGKPTAGNLRLDTATTHYVDPEIGDDAEFTNISNPFTGFAPGITGVDLYATALHELGHLMGFYQGRSDLSINSYLTTTNVDDPNTTTAGNLVALNIGGGPIEATLTNADPGHLWEGPATPATTAAGLPTHPDELMNPGRAIRSNERNLISDFEANLLAQIYGYTIALPSTMNSMLVNPNFTTNMLTISGQSGSVNDLIRIEKHPTISGAYLITATTVEGGTVYTEVVPQSETDTIVANGGDGNDIIRVEYNNGKPTTLNGGNGDDYFDFSFGLRNLNNITGSTTVIGGANNDSIFVYDNNSTTQKIFTITDQRFDRSGWGGLAYGTDMEHEALTTGTAGDSISIQSTGTNRPLVVNSAGGNDGISIGNTTNGVRSIFGDVQIQNDPAYTSLVINNSRDNAIGRDWVINDVASGFGGITGLAPALIYWDNADMQDISLFCSAGADNGVIARLSETLYINNTIEFSAGYNDTIRIGDSSAGGMSAITQGRGGGITIDNLVTKTALTFDDTGSNLARNVTLNYNTDDGYYTFTGMGGTASITGATISYAIGGVSDLAFKFSTGADKFTFLHAQTTTGPMSIDGGGGSDSVILNASNENISRSFTVSLNGISGSSFVFPLTSIEALDMYTGAGDDQLTVQSLPSTTAFRYFAGAGADTMQLGGSLYSWSGQVNGTVTYAAEGGADTLIVNDTDYIASAPAPVYTVVSGKLSTPSGHTVNFDSLCENFEFDARSGGGSTFTVLNYINTQHLTLHGAIGSPTADFLYIDDRTMAGPPNNPASVEIYPNLIKRFFSTTPTTPHLIDYDGWESPTYYGNTANSNTFRIYGVSSQIPAGYQMTIYCGAAVDTVTYYPHDSSGNLTMNGNLGVIGGDGNGDTITFDDTASSSAINYLFNNPYGGGQTNMSGMGLRGIGFGNDFEDAFVKAGSGNDTFRFDSYLGSTRLSIDAGVGNDTLDYSPTSKDLYTTIRNKASISFNGGIGTDRVTIWNDNNPDAWTYERSTGIVLVDKNDGLTGASHFSLLLYDTNNETVAIRGGAAVDSFGINAPITAPAEIHGNGGLDTVSVSSGKVLFAESEDLSSLVLSDGTQAAYTASSSTLLYLQALYLFGSGTLDLNRSDMLLDYPSTPQLGTINAAISRGRHGGDWAGTGIISTAAKNIVNHSTTLGATDSVTYKSQVSGRTKFDNVTLDDTAVVVKYTLYGDDDLNGSVDVADFTRFFANFGKPTGANFSDGDFDSNGNVDVADFTTFFAQFGKTLTAPPISTQGHAADTNTPYGPPSIAKNFAALQRDRVANEILV